MNTQNPAMQTQTQEKAAPKAERVSKGVVTTWIVGLLCVVGFLLDYFGYDESVAYYTKLVASTTISIIIACFVKPVRWARHWPHMIVIAMLANVLWLPLCWTGSVAAYVDRTGRRLGLSKVQTAVYLPALAACGLWVAHRFFPSAF